MSYATIQNLIDAFGQKELLQLTDRERAGSINTAVAERALTDADELINSYLSQRYSLPLPTVPQVVISRACDIARFRLHKEGHEEVRTRYEEAVVWLKDVVAKRAGLGFPETSQQPVGEGPIEGMASFSSNERLFRRGQRGGL